MYIGNAIAKIDAGPYIKNSRHGCQKVGNAVHNSHENFTLFTYKKNWVFGIFTLIVSIF
jgi:hypothetical protein